MCTAFLHVYSRHTCLQHFYMFPVLLHVYSTMCLQYTYMFTIILHVYSRPIWANNRTRISVVGCSSGRFGACFLPGLCKQSDLQVFAARPGLRLWRSDIRGQVEDTRLLKPLFNTQVHWDYVGAYIWFDYSRSMQPMLQLV